MYLGTKQDGSAPKLVPARSSRCRLLAIVQRVQGFAAGLFPVIRGEHGGEPELHLAGGCFLLAANSIITEGNFDAITIGNEDLRTMVLLGPGSAAVFDPDGFRLTYPLDEHTDRLVFANVDLMMIEGAKVLPIRSGTMTALTWRATCGEGYAGPIRANPQAENPVLKAVVEGAA